MVINIIALSEGGMRSGMIQKRKNFRLSTGVCSELRFSKESVQRLKTQQTSADTLTQITERTSRRDRCEEVGVTIMNDDFQDRHVVYTESFVLKKHRLIKCEVAKTEKFWYLTLYDQRADQHYKLRLLKDTGHSIFSRFWQADKRFNDHVFQDQLKRFYFIAPFPPFERKFYFTPIQSSALCDPNDEHDAYIREEIAKLDRTVFIYGKDDE